MVSKTYYFRAMKGMGPEWTDVNVDVAVDDCADLSECEIDDALYEQAKDEMKRQGFKEYTLIEIYNN